MASGLSLVCGDCQTQLRSAQEAQDHAELTGHTNFSESTEAVPTLVCVECGKPCRSKTDVDLHTKRTGHAEFKDKTLEEAKPLQLEQPRAATAAAAVTSAPAAAPPAGGGAGGSSEAGQAVEVGIAPAVNESLKAELVAMGFSEERAVRALHFCGTETVESAVNWIVEHEEDPDIDKPLLISPGDVKKPALSKEEAAAKAQELRERAKKRKDEEEKQRDREREKERLRIGREILEAKRAEEDQERRRIIALKAAEKAEEKRARERILARLAEDKAERRRKLGLPPEEPPKPAPVAEDTPAAPAKKAPVTSAAKARSKSEQMRELLRGLKQAHQADDARVKKAFQTLLTYITNVAQRPDEEKYRRIRLNNAAFQERVGSLTNGVAFLRMCGFEDEEGAAEPCLVLPRAKVDHVLLNAAGGELSSAIANPFFGVL
eukprot:TRINITY_DN19273_c2_g2_i1.p1 TRINITY_DN19273_c2_g2~~TRINITY_DN19273_c2_g2_i1.p1  ORF type:complete len:433 (+),score=118.47 TRINITY_DN19273_c2_g2_i1:168-1466(+)